MASPFQPQTKTKPNKRRVTTTASTVPSLKLTPDQLLAAASLPDPALAQAAITAFLEIVNSDSPASPTTELARSLIDAREPNRWKQPVSLLFNPSFDTFWTTLSPVTQERFCGQLLESVRARQRRRPPGHRCNGPWLRKCREDLNLTQGQLAEKCGEHFAERTIRRAEASNGLQPETFGTIAATLSLLNGMNVETILANLKH
jgi:hypothetical protein